MLRRNGPVLKSIRGVSPEAGRESMGERFVEEVGLVTLDLSVAGFEPSGVDHSWLEWR